MTRSANAPPEVVLITGATSGIGLGLARAFHARGARVIAAGRSAPALVDLEAEGLQTLLLDVRDPQAIASAAEEIRAREGGIDTLVNNAGVQRLVAFDDATGLVQADLDDEIDVNLRGNLHMVRSFLPLLRGRAGARIVQVGSGLGYVPLVAAPIYSATKAATHAFTLAIREQLREVGVQVVLLVPPVVETRLHRDQPVRPPRAMPLAAFTAAAMRGLDERRDDVVVGLARVLRVGARLAPRFFFRNVINGRRTRRDVPRF